MEVQDRKRLKTQHSELEWKLKKVIRESSGETVLHLLPNRLDSSFHNIVCSISKHQVNIYDCAHFGQNLDLFMAFRSEPGEEFLCGAWVKADVEESDALSDSILAVGSKSGKIHLLSLAHCQEIENIDASEIGTSIVGLAGSSLHAVTFISCSTDGNVKIWKRKGNMSVLLGIVSFPSVIVSFANDHTMLLAGKDHTLRKFDISSILESTACRPFHFQVSTLTLYYFFIFMPEKEDDGQIVLKKSNMSKLCHFQVLHDHQVICSFTDGVVLLVDILSEEQLMKWDINNFSKSDPCRFGICPEGDYFVVSNSNGVVYLYDIPTGKKVNMENKEIRQQNFHNNL
ncbi:hypothetical protein Gasu_01940 isoform 2 [Galdieria sulphuraria]|uniref:Transducin family protein / WD-40 repeat family protein n=1 Tax=Galdieria sulphuraria TaxID=130081 RepID=M2X8G4_GALSU|nr:hypothetical protein Gasu_01940 isoform 2 [Galdieria sulphuraria]EME32840.1 hypothetical protein Gasu_01940 isoform 2 [Galdieria sulphuraria]|eukprot:XP_005709360.1 hypothetical protein isoform 2 [Galdieria sulphuraria]